MKKLLLLLTILFISTPSYAQEYIVKVDTDITKFDNTYIQYLFDNWLLVDSIQNLDCKYVQENYTYTACDFALDKPALLTGDNMEQIQDVDAIGDKIKIAIVDSGIDLHNPSLQKYIDKSYNVSQKNEDVQDDCGHGTHIAGIVTHLSQNKILPVKVLDNSGMGKSSDIAMGIRWATDNGAKIINLSLGGVKYDEFMKESIDYAVEHGCIVVCASGNTYGEKMVYPACYDNVISVGALDKERNISKYSNRGDSVDVYAFGDITSLDLDGGYTQRSGTSMACAIVSAELSLIF